MSPFDDHFRFRDELASRLILDLLGPTNGIDEVLVDPPVNTYLTGVLFPRRPSDEVVDDTVESDIDLANSRLDKDERPDTGVSMANLQNPSSMGLTFTVHARRCQSLTITVNAAVYEPIDAAGQLAVAEMNAARSTDESSIRWRRRPIVSGPFTVDIVEAGTSVRTVVPGLEVRVFVRPVVRVHDTVTVTVTLVNMQIAEGPLRDPWCFFQCGLAVVSDPTAAIVEATVSSGDEGGESLVSSMLYRHAPTFAIGHGCAAEWSSPEGAVSTSGEVRRAVEKVYSSCTPTYDVHLSESNPDIDTSGLRMIDLAEGDTEEVLKTLRGLVEAYRHWIEDRRIEAAGLPAKYAKVAADQLRQCGIAYERMYAGIELLSIDRDVMRAFKLANRAMAAQRSHTALMREQLSSTGTHVAQWYPFQIGFILLCLQGIADPKHEDRDIADLLWFPTGGGKTEAYLGLIAFTVFLRRIRRGQLGGGVTVLMRYTLRLLTLQQFERAATLICAMEDIRRRESDLANEEISIGMWVGASATPNKLSDAEKGIRDLRAGKKLQDNNPVQLRRCPWCGIDIGELNYSVDRSSQRVVVACGNTQCDFHNGLPVHLVDETVYQHRPTLIIATVDKFAQMAWKGEPAALFNKVGAIEGTPPPELIIQDELHLISGPLGTLVGIYESAIDIAAHRPKVVASTATIRRAGEQGKALFDRDVHQFPPSGLDARDSWFAVEAEPERKPSRRYVGLFAPGTSQATLLVRAYAALLHHATTIDGNDEVRDAYWTLVGYFNSLRLLAAAELQVNDDVAGRLKKLVGDGTARAVETAELTSRVDASDIPIRLRQLDVRFPDRGALDVVLATNMISVGVDVNRLCLMAITGQPQTTAEYIQATSRVGRRDPGMVVVLYNAARSRDRSHYENFRAYHSALYRQVESTSVTPFSARARDRALHAALIAAARMTIASARENEGASRLNEFRESLKNLVELFIARVERVAPDEAASTAQQIGRIVQNWERLLDYNGELVYHKAKWAGDQRHRSDGAALLRAFEDDDLPYSFATMNSLRDVDVETDLVAKEARS